MLSGDSLLHVTLEMAYADIGSSLIVPQHYFTSSDKWQQPGGHLCGKAASTLCCCLLVTVFGSTGMCIMLGCQV